VRECGGGCAAGMELGGVALCGMGCRLSGLMEAAEGGLLEARPLLALWRLGE
jgi:hypothetical protein